MSGPEVVSMDSPEQEDHEMIDALPASRDEAAIGESPSPQPSTVATSAMSPTAAVDAQLAPAADPNFKFKYPEARPTPPGEDDILWNKIFTAADSRMYNKHGKDANNSKKFRASGETRKLALTMLEERKAKDAAGIPPRATAKPKVAVAVAVAKKPPPSMKKESSTGSYEDGQGFDVAMSISEKIKSEGRARKVSSVAPTSNSGTPAPSSAPNMSSPTPPAVKVDKPVLKKKGTAAPVKKPAKKAKIEGYAGTPSSSARASQTPGPTAASSPSDDSESSRDGTLYCICRRPDDHRLMIECIHCKDWYHPPCMNILDSDVRSGLVDTFVCNKCTTADRFTSFRRMCRYHNVDKSCRIPARVGDDPPSKYCSDEHKVAFWEFIYSKVRADDRPSMGGALNREEVGALLKACPTVEEFHGLGQKPRLPVTEDTNSDRPIGFNYITSDEEDEIAALTEKKNILNSQILGFQNQAKLLTMVHERAKLAAKQMGVNDKTICGFDYRLCFNDVQFLQWYNSNEGQAAFVANALGPRTEETKEINKRNKAAGQTALVGPEAPEPYKDICIAVPRKCKHLAWRELHNQDLTESQNILRKDLRKLEKRISEIIDDAETREATKAYYADNFAVRLF